MSEGTMQLNNVNNIVQVGGTSRNRIIDIIKAFGIILMVCGHSGGPFENFIYLFHMAIFFIASGFCWNDKNVRDFIALRKYIFRKIMSLYVPYVLWNGLNTLLTNFFVWCRLYPPESSMSLKEVAVNLLKNLTLGGGAGFAGATWFLRTLLYISIGHAIWMFLTNRLKWGWICRLVLLVLCAGAAQLVSSFSIGLPKGLQTCFSAYLVFVFGICFIKYNWARFIDHFRILIAAGCFGLLLLLNQFGGISGSITYLPFYAAASIAGWVLLWEIATFLPSIVSKIIEYIGKHTLDIVLLHFLAFRVVSAIYVAAAHSDISLLAAFPVIEDVPFLWIPYTLVGVAVPLLLGAGGRKIKLMLKGLHHT